MEVKKKIKKQDIDDLFGKLNDKQKPIKEKDKKLDPKQQVQKTKKVNKSKEKQQVSNKQKFTEEGFKIYTEDDLKLEKGGNTNLCPFDCECCF
ncbi:hypothetical protein pb186bvf_000774 [Paramecium bursaria]